MRSTAFLAEALPLPERVLDLGAGTGLLTACRREFCPWFLNYDQFTASSPVLKKKLDEFWTEQVLHSALSETELSLWRERRKLDSECSPDAETAMLRRAGFQKTDCVFLEGKIAVIAAQK